MHGIPECEGEILANINIKIGQKISVDITYQVIYQTRETVFHRDIQTPRRELKIRRAAEYF